MLWCLHLCARKFLSVSFSNGGRLHLSRGGLLHGRYRGASYMRDRGVLVRIGESYRDDTCVSRGVLRYRCCRGDSYYGHVLWCLHLCARVLLSGSLNHGELHHLSRGDVLHRWHPNVFVV